MEEALLRQQSARQVDISPDERFRLNRLIIEISREIKKRRNESSGLVDVRDQK